MPNKIISYVEKHPNITYYFSCVYHSFDFEYMHSFIVSAAKYTNIAHIKFKLGQYSQINSDEMKKLNQLITDPKLPLYLEINTDLSSKLDDKISSLIEHSIRPLTVKVAVNDNTCSDMIVPLINAIYINYQHTNGLSLLDLWIEPYDQTFRSQIIGAENDQYKNQALMAIEHIKIAIQGRVMRDDQSNSTNKSTNKSTDSSQYNLVSINKKMNEKTGEAKNRKLLIEDMLIINIDTSFHIIN
ncbi:hypothetical protein ACTFIZ_012346 [Dictyostelium cf. discoideum]